MIVRQVEAGAYDIEYCSLIVQHPERATQTMDQSIADRRLLAFFGGNTDWRGAYDWEPVVQLTTAAGQGVSRPSEESVRRAAFGPRKTGEWICLARSSGEFVQAEPTGAGLFAIERSRDGLGWPERSTRKLMAPELADVLADYLGGRDGWQESHEWQSVPRDKPQGTGCSAVLVAFAGALLVLASVMT
jgi:hypothetical protein